MGKVEVFLVLISIMIASAVLIPLVRGAFENNSSSVDASKITEGISAADQGGDDTGTSSFWQVIKVISTIAFWSFGNIPFLLDLLFYTPIRIVLWYIVAATIWRG